MADLSDEETRHRARRQSDTDLLIGVRRNDIRLLRAFVQRFEPMLLDQARRMGVRRDERGTVVTGFLDDILVKLADSPPPRSLTAFVVTSFRNCVLDEHREETRRARHSALQEQLDGTERVVIAACSEFMLRAAEGPELEYEGGATHCGANLVRALFAECSREDRQLLVWTAHRVPLRECAAWLGISHDSARQRLSRLRARLIRDSIAHLPDLPASERADVCRLLHRAGVTTDNNRDEGSAA